MFQQHAFSQRNLLCVLLCLVTFLLFSSVSSAAPSLEFKDTIIDTQFDGIITNNNIPFRLEIQNYAINDNVELRIYRGNYQIGTRMYAKNTMQRRGSTYIVVDVIPLEMRGMGGETYHLTAHLGGATATSPTYQRKRRLIGQHIGVEFKEPLTSVVVTQSRPLRVRVEFANLGNTPSQIELREGTDTLKTWVLPSAQLTPVPNTNKVATVSTLTYAELKNYGAVPGKQYRLVATAGSKSAESASFTVAMPTPILVFTSPQAGSTVESTGRAYFRVEVENMQDGVLRIELLKGTQVIRTLFTYNKSQLASVPNSNKLFLSSTIPYQQLIDMGAYPGNVYRFAARLGNSQIYSPEFAVIRPASGQATAPSSNGSANLSAPPR